MADPYGLDEDNVNIKDWDSELFGCGAEPSTFVFACCCPCFAAGEVYTNGELGHCGIGCVLWCLFRGACHPCCVTMKIRKLRGIRGSLLTDCLSIYCCSPCQLTRELREVREVRDVRDDRGY